MVGILSPEMLEIARFKAASLAESSSWLSAMMIFKETILLGSAVAWLEVVWLVAGGSGAALTGTEEAAGETGEDEAGVAVSVEEVDADVGEPAAATDADEGEADTAVTVADSGVTETVDPG